MHYQTFFFCLDLNFKEKPLVKSHHFTDRTLAKLATFVIILVATIFFYSPWRRKQSQLGALLLHRVDKATQEIGLPEHFIDHTYPPETYLNASTETKLILLNASAHTNLCALDGSAIEEGIAQNAYCSRDIYFQFKKVCRTVISRVIIHRRLERA